MPKRSQLEEKDLQLNQVKIEALEAMQRRARVLGVTKGVAAVLMRPDDQAVFDINWCAVGPMVREPDPANRGPDDKGTNYLAVVLSKIAEMVDTHYDSGNFGGVLKTGELGFRGGLTKRHLGGYLYTAFSGGTAEEDVLIAMAGMNILNF